MSNFKPIYNIEDIKLSNNWVESSSFKNKDSIVNENGKPISSEYQGRQYQLISKKERPFSSIERVGRVILGLLAVIFSLAVALCSKSIRGLFTQKKSTIKFGLLIPKVPSSEELVEKTLKHFNEHFSSYQNPNFNSFTIALTIDNNKIEYSKESNSFEDVKILLEEIIEDNCTLKEALQQIVKKEDVSIKWTFIFENRGPSNLNLYQGHHCWKKTGQDNDPLFKNGVLGNHTGASGRSVMRAQ